MSKNWYVRRNGKIIGPISSSDLKHIGESGDLDSSDQVSNSLEGPWHSAAKVKGLQVRHVEKQLITQPSPVPSGGDYLQSEGVIWKGRPSQWTNFPTFVRCTLFCWLIIPIFYGLYKFFLVMSTRYEVTNERFNMTSGVFSRTSDSLELFRVRDSRFQQSFVQRMVGLGDVLLATTDTNSRIIAIKSIPNAQELREKIRNIVERQRERKGVRAIEYC